MATNNQRGRQRRYLNSSELAPPEMLGALRLRIERSSSSIAQAGWLDRLGRGVYAKPGTALDLDASLWDRP